VESCLVNIANMLASLDKVADLNGHLLLVYFELLHLLLLSEVHILRLTETDVVLPVEHLQSRSADLYPEPLPNQFYTLVSRKCSPLSKSIRIQEEGLYIVVVPASFATVTFATWQYLVVIFTPASDHVELGRRFYSSYLKDPPVSSQRRVALLRQRSES